MAKRKNIMLGTAGHVDHGKTALVKLLTGCDTDTLAEEKRRGLTIDIGFAPCRLADERIVGVVDVPGHVDFIRNMVAGAQGIDVVILVVAADDGVMPQTREHLDILTLMGVRHGLVALTKIDLVDAQMRQMAADEVRGFLAGTFLASAPICGVSNITGEGFEAFFDALNAQADACQERPSGGLFRLWVEDVFSIRGFGTVATGIPSSGQVRVGDRLHVAGAQTTARVRGMEVYGEQAQAAQAGECVALNLDIDAGRLGRGAVLAESAAMAPLSMAEAHLRLLPSAAGGLKDYAEVHLHVGTGETMAHVAVLSGADHLAAGDQTFVQLRLRQPLPVAPGERFVIRAPQAHVAAGHLTTIGGGRILGTGGVKLRRNRPWVISSLSARLAAIDSPDAWCELMLKEAVAPLTADELAGRAGLRAEQASAALERLQRAGLAQAAEEQFVHAAVIAEAAGELERMVRQFHADNPWRLGIEQAELLARWEMDRGLFEPAMERLTGAGVLQRRGAVIAPAGARTHLPPRDQELCERVAEALKAAHLSPPLPAELAQRLGEPPESLQQMLRLLQDQGLVVRLDEKVVMHREAVAAARQVVLDLFGRCHGFETVQFRDALGVSRKYAVPLLDYFDTVRLTVRSGSRRTPGAEAKKLLGPA